MPDKFNEPKVKLKVTTYELVSAEKNEWSPVISHEFYGNTKEEAFAALEAHLKYDNFFKSSFTGTFVEGNKKIQVRNSDITSI